MTEKKSQSSKICVWDATVKKSIGDPRKWLQTWTKKWCYQEEKGEGGYEHYQVRFSLKVAERKNTLLKKIPKGWHISITSAENRDNMFYVMKEEGRIAGPWTDTDPVMSRELKWLMSVGLLPWQKEIVESFKTYDCNHVNILIQKKGLAGKSMLVDYLEYHKLAECLPPYNDMKEMSQAAWGAVDTYEQGNFMFDMPRSLKKDKLWQFFAGIELMKSGKLFDTRYQYKRRRLAQRPVIWVMTNDVPDLTLLTRKRWKLWWITKEGELHKWYKGAPIPEDDPCEDDPEDPFYEKGF